MTFWFDAHLSPKLVQWFGEQFKVESKALRGLGLRDSADEEIFGRARKADVVFVTKDLDFVDLLLKHGPPPRVIWLTCGNTSDKFLRSVFERYWVSIQKQLDDLEALVEIQ